MDPVDENSPGEGDLVGPATKRVRMYFTIFLGTSYCIFRVQNPWTQPLSAEGPTIPTVSYAETDTTELESLTGGLFIALGENEEVLAECWLHPKMPECMTSNAKEVAPCMLDMQKEKNLLCIRFCPAENLFSSASFKGIDKGFSWTSTSKMELCSNRDVQAISELVRMKHGTTCLLIKTLSLDGVPLGSMMELHGQYGDLGFHQFKEILFDRDFKIVRTLGKGSFGTVYLCKCLFDSKLYAVKKSNPIYGDFKEPSEVKVLSILRNKNIIDMTYAWREQDTLSRSMKVTYVVMESCDMSVASLLPLSPTEGHMKDSIFQQLVASLNYLHAKGVLHRDLKPDNLLLLAGVLKVADFGNAAIKSTPDTSFNGRKEYGSKGYTAPELTMLFHLHTEKVDVYGAGGTYYMLHNPRAGDVSHMLDLSKKVQAGGLCRNDSQLFDGWTGEFDLLQVMLQSNPANRISAPQLAALLAERNPQG